MSIESPSGRYGALFGDWQIRRTLGGGSGGRTAVFELYRNSSGWDEFSALKVVSLIEERGRRESFSLDRRNEYDTAMREHKAKAEQEVRLMEQLRGKTNIVDYLDHKFVSWSDDYGFGMDLLIRMELLKDLRGELRQGRTFREEEIIRIGKDICRALMICHGKGILHRDIKPENIFFNADGDYKLGDFGISRMIGSGPAMASTGIGTPEYAAPEQSSGRYDKSVDIYSLGLVLYELSNKNRLPFASSSYTRLEEVQLRLQGKPLPKPERVGEQLSGVILKACAFRPEDRFRSAEEMLQALEEAERGKAGFRTVKTGNDRIQTSHLAGNEAQTYQLNGKEARTHQLNGNAERIYQLNGNETWTAYSSGERRDIPEVKKTTDRSQTMVLLLCIAAVMLLLMLFAVTMVLLGDRDDNSVEEPSDPEDVIIIIDSEEKPVESPENTPVSTPSLTPTPEPTPDPASLPAVNVAAPANPCTPYGKAYRDHVVNGTYYTDRDVLDLIGETYSNRKDTDGKYKEGCSSGRNKTNDYGYDFGFYYGDDLLYFVEVRTPIQTVTQVKLYYWGDQLIGCRDYRGTDSSLCTAGHPIFEAVAEEFSYVYALGARTYGG